MNLSFDGKMRNYIFMAILSLAIIIIIMASVVGGRQDRAYRDNYNRYQQASQLIKEQKYAQAQQILSHLDTDSQASYQVLYMQAFCAEKLGDLTAAAQLMQKARETRPAMLREQKYLVEYGIILYKSGDFEQAQLYLQESLKYSQDAATSQTARSYLAEIDKKSKPGR
jgi:tetratricopeptide (TPR) repeat protein